MTKKERALLKGAIRRVYARSDIHKRLINATIITGYTDASRKRVKTWCYCMECAKPTPKSYMRLDHKDPIVPLDKTFEELIELTSWDHIIDLVWCREDNLQAICIECHDRKTKGEANERKRSKAAKKSNKNSR